MRPVVGEMCVLKGTVGRVLSMTPRIVVWIASGATRTTPRWFFERYAAKYVEPETVKQ